MIEKNKREKKKIKKNETWSRFEPTQRKYVVKRAFDCTHV